MYNKLFKHFKKPNNGKKENRLSTDKDNENRNSTKTNDSDWLPESQSNYSTSGMPVKNYMGIELDPKEIILIERIDIDPNSGNPKGATAEVWRAKLKGTEVAIKILKLNPNYPNVNKIIDSFKGQIALACRVNHPNICQYLGSYLDEDENKYVMVFEKLKRDLLDFVRDKSEFNLLKKLKIAQHITKGLAWLHEVGIVHDDLKPENILLDQNDTPKITDFGYAELKKMNKLLLEEDPIKIKGGAKLYMSPQRLKGAQGDEKSDVYSFSLILWELVTGDRPFESHLKAQLPANEIIANFIFSVCDLNERPAIPKGIKDNYPSLAHLITRCWDRDPDARPTFQELVEKFNDILVDVAIADDPYARDWWKSNFAKERIGKRLFKGLGGQRVTVPLFDEETRNKYNSLKVRELSVSVSWSSFVSPFLRILRLDPSISEVVPPETPTKVVLPDQPQKEELMTVDIRTLREFGARNEECKKIMGRELERRQNIIKLNCARRILVDDQDKVNIERFGKICSMFGPLYIPSNKEKETLNSAPLPSHFNSRRYDLLDNIFLVMSKPYFHGDIDKDEAHIRLKYKDTGAFLLRFSSRQTNFVISVVIDRKDQKFVTHLMIQHSSRGFGFTNGTELYPDIDTLIHKNSSIFKLPTPIEYISPAQSVWLDSVALQGAYVYDEVKIDW